MFCHREDCALCREGECLIGDKLCSPDRCVGSRAAQERYETLKAMNLLAKVTNNEGFYYDHWILAEADDDELREIAYDDEGIFSDAVRCFINHFSKYAKEGGLYLGGARYPD